MGIQRARNSGSWRNKRKCRNLTPQEADKIFFPKPGGKSKAAKEFCSDCPVINKCLDEAITLGLIGMWAGTTDGERRRMVEFIGSIDVVMPPEPTAQTRRPKRIPADPNPLRDPLYGVEGPSLEEVIQLEWELGL